MTKKKLLELNKKCINLIRRKPYDFLVFKKIRYFGWCYDASFGDQEQLIVDHRKSPIRTAYHECLHYLYPDWSETKVLTVESKMINRLPMLDIATFMKYVAIKMYKSELSKKLKKRRKSRKQKLKNKTVA